LGCVGIAHLQEVDSVSGTVAGAEASSCCIDSGCTLLLLQYPFSLCSIPASSTLTSQLLRLLLQVYILAVRIAAYVLSPRLQLAAVTASQPYLLVRAVSRSRYCVCDPASTSVPVCASLAQLTYCIVAAGSCTVFSLSSAVLMHGLWSIWQRCVAQPVCCCCR
jgi:hypothetical protein